MDSANPQPQTDQNARLVNRAQQGDRAAFEELAAGYRGAVLAIARSRIATSEAEDLAQEVFVRAWERITDLRDPSAFGSWLSKLAVNACNQWRRRNGRINLSLDGDAIRVISDEPDPLTEVLRTEQSIALRDALLALPNDNRHALILHLWGQYEYTEIAAKTGVPLTTVEGRIHRAKNQLRRLLGYTRPQPARQGGTASMAGNRRKPILVPQFGHSGCICGIAVSPDGRRFATSDNTGSLIVWDMETLRQELRVSEAHYSETMCFSPDGRMLAFHGFPGDTIVYDVARGVRLCSLPVGCAAMQFEGDRLWTASWAPDPESEPWKKANLICWDIASRKVLQRVENLAGSPLSLSADLTRLVTMQGTLVADRGVLVRMDDAHLLVWDARSGEMVSRLDGIAGYVWRRAIARDGSLMAASSWDSDTSFDVLVWDTASGRLLYTLADHKERVGALAFNFDGSVLATADLAGTVLCWDARDGSVLSRIENGRRIDALAFTADGRKLISRAPADQPEGQSIWDWRTGKAEVTLPQHTGWLETAAITGDGSKLLACGYDSRFQIWDCKTGQLSMSPEARGKIASVSTSPSGSKAAACVIRFEDDKPYSRLAVVDTESASFDYVSQERPDRIHRVAFSPAGRIAAVCRGTRARVMSGKVIEIVDIDSWAVLRELRHPEDWFVGDSMVFSPDGRLIFSPCTKETPNGATEQGQIRCWNVDSGELVRVCADDERGFETLALSPDGTVLAAGMRRGAGGDKPAFEMRLFDAATGEQLRTLDAPKPVERLLCMAFSPDGRVIASGSCTGVLIIWEPHTGKLLRSVKHHSSAINTVLFSPDGRLLFEVRCDGLLACWRVADLIDESKPEEALVMAALDGGENWLACSPDGRYDCSPGAEGYLLWRKGSEFFTTRECEAKFHRPGLIARVIAECPTPPE